MAGLLALTGDPEENVQVFLHIQLLFLHPARIYLWRRVLEEMPAREDTVRHIARCVEAYQRHVTKRPIQRQNLNLMRVVQAMLAVKDPEHHVRRCAEEGFDHAGSIFHENTVAAGQQRYRGVQGKLSSKETTDAILRRVRRHDA